MKILVLGDHQSGKTSIIKRFVYDYYSAQYKPTVGVDFHSKVLNIDGVDFNVSFWDIVGADKAGSVAKVYYRKASGILLVCDYKDPQFKNLAKWKHDVDKNVCLRNGHLLPVVLMVNKADNVTDLIDKQQFDKEHMITGWFATSAKEQAGLNVSMSVYKLLDAILSSDRCVVRHNTLPNEDEITFITEPTPTTKVFGGCMAYIQCIYC